VFSLFIYHVICAIFWFSVEFSESLQSTLAFLSVQGANYKKSYDNFTINYSTYDISSVKLTIYKVTMVPITETSYDTSILR